jgi:ABC-2 type transport system ATP-binding protein
MMTEIWFRPLKMPWNADAAHFVGRAASSRIERIGLVLPMSTRPVIQVSGIRKTYSSTVAVDQVSFEVIDGEIFGLIGPNGAGKTTTMECIEGLRRPDRGTISVLGFDPFRQVYELQPRIGIQLQQAQLQKRIKVWEALDLWASLYGTKGEDVELLLQQLGLAEKRNTWFMDLSGGRSNGYLSPWR